MCANFINKGILLNHRNEVNYEIRIINSEKSKQQSKEQVHFILINSTLSVYSKFIKIGISFECIFLTTWSKFIEGLLLYKNKIVRNM